MSSDTLHRQESSHHMKSLILDLQEGLHGLKLFNTADEICSYFEDIDSKIIMSVESAMKHLDQIKTEMLQKTAAYREEQLARSAHFDDCRRFVNEYECLSDEISAFSKKCSKRINDGDNQASDLNSTELVEEARKETNAIMKKIKDVRAEMRKSAFDNRFLNFKQNWLFLIENDHIGTLEYSSHDMNQRALDSAIKVDENPAQVFKAEYQERCPYDYSATFLSSGQVAFITKDAIYIKDAHTGEDICILKLHYTNSLSQMLALEELSHGFLVAGDSEGYIYIYRIQDAVLFQRFRAHLGWLEQRFFLKALRDGKLASATQYVVKIWKFDLKLEPTLLHTLEKYPKIYLPLSMLSNGYLLVNYFNAENASFRIWNPHNGRMIKHIQTGVSGVICYCLLNDDRVALGIYQEFVIFDLVQDVACKLIKVNGFVFELIQLRSGHFGVVNLELKPELVIVDSNTEEHVQSFVIHDDTLNTICLSQDAKSLLTGSIDKTIKIWALV